MEKVSVYLQLCGDYVAFHEIRASVLYDLTNNIMVDEYYESLEAIEEAIAEKGDYCDIEMVDAIRTEDGQYFYQIKKVSKLLAF